jgi:N-acetylmuramoyl-L-alanine amidase
MLFLLMYLSTAFGSELLEQVRLFSGPKHMRVLVQLGEDVEHIKTQAMPGTTASSAKIYIKITGPEIEDESGFTVEHDLVSRLVFTKAQGGTQLTANLKQSAIAKVHRINERVLVIDIMETEYTQDPNVPTLETLERWVNQIGLIPDPNDIDDKFRIVLDPGHGGEAHGAVGTTGTREADIALELAHRTAYYLEQHDNVEVIFTRTGDEFVSLAERARIANSSSADIFLSIHANAAPTSDLWGIETYSMDTASDEGAARVASRENAMAERKDGSKDMLLGNLITTGTNRLSKELAVNIQEDVIRELRSQYGQEEIRDLGAKTALFYVLVSTTMPAVLFEASFLSNPEDERRLRAPHFQNATAEALADSVYNWLESQE